MHSYPLGDFTTLILRCLYIFMCVITMLCLLLQVFWGKNLSATILSGSGFYRSSMILRLQRCVSVGSHLSRPPARTYRRVWCSVTMDIVHRLESVYKKLNRKIEKLQFSCETYANFKTIRSALKLVFIGFRGSSN